jgi:hypothetical protein
MSDNQKIIDLNALKFNQISIIVLLLTGFIFNLRIIPVFVAVVMLTGSLEPRLALFKQFFRYVLKPLKLVKPKPVYESPAPHNFAQLLGGFVLAISSLLLLCESIIYGWIFTWIVILLALANVIFGFCAGCFIYFQLGKYNIPGFQNKPNN